MFLYSVYLILFKIRNCYGLILLNLKKNEKNIKIDKAMQDNMGELFCETPFICYGVLITGFQETFAR